MSRGGLTQSSRDAIDATVTGTDATVARASRKPAAPRTRRRSRGRSLTNQIFALGFLPPKFRFGLFGFALGVSAAAWFAVDEVDRRIRAREEDKARERRARRQRALELREANKLNGVPIIEEIEDEDDSRFGLADNGTKTETEYKMVLLVREDLPMGAGKVAAQAGHAAVGAVSLVMENRMLLGRWEADGQKKVALGVKSLRKMDELVEQARRSRLNVFEVLDAGRTEVDPGTKTVVAIGPAASSDIDAITGGLRLY
ncbi:Peptidyl-tRNA hydrolase, PTH2 [Ostreococcus tauri]|nr:Peptidyl-tRNA hydrolase, PTH2 [Ostreococcus tauri]CEF99517.1 Peptidyl-tRNA hydrolase, PTH2 [Ostreococcus tauri]|eukprot:XP_003081827.2 Peptidyl-tRNA hydrolase, PTH2 [Ostreococcus tauri]